MIGESKRSNAFLPEKSFTNSVLATAFGFVVLTTVEFDAEVQLGAEEIEHVRLHRMLSAKLPATDATASQDTPKIRFRIGGLLAEFSREGNESEFFVMD